jgi:hypothetical protein
MYYCSLTFVKTSMLYLNYKSSSYLQLRNPLVIKHFRGTLETKACVLRYLFLRTLYTERWIKSITHFWK